MKGASDKKENLPTPVLLNYGGASKFIAEMNADELETASRSIVRRAREKAFSKGLPVYYHKNAILIAEFSDGRIVPVTKK